MATLGHRVRSVQVHAGKAARPTSSVHVLSSTALQPPVRWKRAWDCTHYNSRPRFLDLLRPPARLSGVPNEAAMSKAKRVLPSETGCAPAQACAALSAARNEAGHAQRAAAEQAAALDQARREAVAASYKSGGLQARRPAARAQAPHGTRACLLRVALGSRAVWQPSSMLYSVYLREVLHLVSAPPLAHVCRASTASVMLLLLLSLVSLPSGKP